MTNNIALGSRSPRRLQLLQQLIPADRIEVLPPRSVQEPGFNDLHAWPALQKRLGYIANCKCNDVVSQIESGPKDEQEDEISAVITADTVMVTTEDDGRLIVLGQPPQNAAWGKTVRKWFTTYYAGRTHFALTALCVEKPGRPRCERIVKSQVTFRADVEDWLDWYISTGEPIGKAGGYALQGVGSIFVERLEGSISNVIGLPLEALLEIFGELGIDVEPAASSSWNL